VVPASPLLAIARQAASASFSVPRGLLAGTLVAAALVWGPYALIPGSSLLSAQIQTGIYLGLLLLTICSRRAKVLAALNAVNVRVLGADLLAVHVKLQLDGAPAGETAPARRDDGRAAGNAGPGIYAELAGQPHADSFPRPRRSALSKASRT
jgi:hypothetical protein